MTVHRVRQGESVATLAARGGVHPESIWEHPDNAELKELRKNPFVLKPGDLITIPDPEPREENVATERVHEFILSRALAQFEARFLDEGVPRANWKYYLWVDGETETRTGELDGDGHLTVEIPAEAENGVIHLYPPDEDDEEADSSNEHEDESGHDPAADADYFIEYELNFHHLDPVDEPSGARQRLHHLGLYAGGEEDGIGPKTRAAIRAFQRLKGLDVTGELDGPTIDKLRSEHG